MTIITRRDRAGGPGLTPEQIGEYARLIAIEEGAQPGDVKAINGVLERIAAHALIGGLHRFPPLSGKAHVNPDNQTPVR